MNTGMEITALIFTAALGGMRITYGVDAWKGDEMPFYRVWTRKTMYQGVLFWLVMLGGAWLLVGAVTGYPPARCMLAVRLVDLAATYVVLAVIDCKTRVVPDRVLVCYFLGQILLGSACETPQTLLSCLIGGSVFAVLIICFAWMSKGKIGLGDAKLLGVTAVTAGWMYTIQIVAAGLLVSFFYSIWLLLFRRLNAKAEFPFVPFLTLGLVIHTVFFVL